MGDEATNPWLAGCRRGVHRFALRQTTGRETCVDCFAELHETDESAAHDPTTCTAAPVDPWSCGCEPVYEVVSSASRRRAGGE